LITPNYNRVKIRDNEGKKMAKGKNVLTTGDVARICNVAPRTVSKWFDSGQLKGYRIPGSKDRRIPLGELIRFMKMHNIPANALPVGKIRILLVDTDKKSAAELTDALRSKNDYDVQIVHNNFETGATIQSFAPHVILINMFADGVDAIGICKSIRDNEDMQAIKIIALTNNLSNSEATTLLQKGFDAYISDSSDTDEIIKTIEEAIAIIY
jgi:CheY-like chemotaxis protein